MLTDIEQPSLFDYASLDGTTRTFVQEKTVQLHELDRREAEVAKHHAEIVLEKGLLLLSVKERLSDQTFSSWLHAEFCGSHRTAYRYLKVARKYRNDCDRLSQLYIDIPNAVDTAISDASDTVIEMVETRQMLPALSVVQEAKREYQEPIQEHTASQQSVLPEPDYSSSVGTYELSRIQAFDAIDAGILDVEVEDEEEEVIMPVKSIALTALQSSESNEWYTPAQYAAAARELMGGIDVDPASCQLANETIQAKKFYTKKDNGLVQSWGNRVWLNPPYGFDGGMSNQELWTRELIGRYKAGLVTEAVLLVNANTEAKWFQPLYDYLICFTNHRIRFYNDSGESSQPTQGNALVYFGPKEKHQRFIEIFKQFGTIMRRVG